MTVPPPWVPTAGVGPASGARTMPGPLATAAFVVGISAVGLSALWGFGEPVALSLFYSQLHWSGTGWSVAWHVGMVLQLVLGVIASGLGVGALARAGSRSARAAIAAGIGVALILEAVVNLASDAIAGSIR